MHVVVIGAGIGGLAAAALLGKEGHRVTVYERNTRVGGKMNEIKTEGFRFDTGPSLLTMPELLRDLFKRCGADMADYLELVPVEPLCRYFYRDGTILDSYHDRSKALEEIRRIAPGDAKAYADFLDYASRLYEKTSGSFLFNPLFDISDLARVNPLHFLDIDSISTVSSRVDSYFQSPYLRQFFKRFATYNGSSPFQAPATLNVIPHVELNKGGYYVAGGMYRIAKSLRRLAEAHGVQFNFGRTVNRIHTYSGRATGVELEDGTVTDADVVLSNADARLTYLELLPEQEISAVRKKAVAGSEPSSSGFVLLLGTNRRFERLRHHNIFFSGDYEAEFNDIFRKKVPPEDPTLYIADTSRTDPSHAVEGGANLFVLVNAPYLTGRYDWNRSKHEYAVAVKNRLEQRGLEGLNHSILFEKIITPLDFQTTYRSSRGSIYGTSSNKRVSAFLRPGNKARSVEGLYLAGGSTHPGGGIPLVILSAMHACELIRRYEPEG